MSGKWRDPRVPLEISASHSITVNPLEHAVLCFLVTPHYGDTPRGLASGFAGRQHGFPWGTGSHAAVVVFSREHSPKHRESRAVQKHAQGAGKVSKLP